MDILIKELDPGQKYILQARAKSASGNTSSWSTAFEHTTLSDTVAPSPVTGLTWDSVGTSFVAQWTKPLTDSNGKPLKDFRDYQVTITAGTEDVIYYVGQEKFDFPIEANRNSFGSPEPDLDISVKVRDRVGNLSTAVTANAVNPIPSNVSNFVADGVTSGIALSWDAVTDIDIKNYEVYTSTSGSGFTPGPSNLIYAGNSNSLFFSTTTLVVHYFKVRAVDVFNQGSAAYASASATPVSSSGIDLTPPDDPTNVEVTTTAGSNGLSSISVIWDAVVSGNLSDYLVRYSLDEVVWQYINVPAGQEDALIDNLLSDTDYYIQVAAMSYANAKSDFVNADVYPITTAADTTSPSQPSAPTVSVTTFAAQVSHDMTKQAGGDLESDVDYLEVHASTTNGFTPSNTTLRGTISSAAQGIDVSGVFYFPTTDAVANLYWKVIAVDRAKNKSTASSQVTGTPGLILNANIGNATITSAKINDLEANKITAGTGIINDLAIKSTLTIDSAGHLQSSNWNGTDTGYKLDTGGLTIYSGTISAAALLLQDSANIIPPAFADFEFNEDYYHAGGTANTVVWSTVGTGINIDIQETDQRFGNKCLRVSNGAITNPTVHDVVLAPGGLTATGVNIDVSPGTYIFSGYFKKNASLNALLKFGFYPETGSAIVSSASTVNSTSWTRFEAQLVVPSGVSRVKAYLEIGPAVSNTGYDMLIDGLQVERKMTGATTAGPYRPPSKTVIDGGQIVTGSIRSTASSPLVPTQPAWSINTAGNMQIGDAQVRGSITVGNASAPLNLMPTQFTSFENTSSYYHDGSNIQNDANFNGVSMTATPNHRVQIVTDPVSGTQALRIFDTTGPTTGNNRSVSFTTLRLIPAGNNIDTIAGRTYWISAYFKNRNALKQVKVGFAVFYDGASFISAMTGGDVDISTSTAAYTRVSGSWTAPVGRSNCQIVLFITPIGGSTGFDISMDALMVELGQIGQVAPSTYTDTVGELSYVRSGNYISGLSGWSIGNDGTAEFNDGFFRGQLDISSFFNSQAFGTNISTAPVSWRSKWTAFNYTVSGIEPTILLSGTGFKPNQSGGLDTTNPFQVLFRGTPEGGYQIMADGTNKTRVFLVDANNDLDSSFNDIEDIYGYSDLRAGRGYDRSFTAQASASVLQNNNMYYSQMHTKSQALKHGSGSDEVQAQAYSGLHQRTDASPLSYQFVPFASNKLYAFSEMTTNGGNIIPDPWDIMDGVIATYNSNSTKNRVQLNSMGTRFSPYGPTTSSITTSGLINVIQATFLSAGTGDSITWLSSTDTTYNVTVESGAEYSMGMQFDFPNTLLGKQFQFMMKLSNGTILTSNLVTMTNNHVSASGGGISVKTTLSMGYANTWAIPAGITTCLVGFKIIGGVASNTNFAFGGGLLYKTRNADGTYTSQYNNLIQVERSKSWHWTSSAEVKVFTTGMPKDIWYDGGLADNQMSKISLYSDRMDYGIGGFKSFEFNVTPEGAQWGTNTEYRPQHGVSIAASGLAINVLTSGTQKLPVAGANSSISLTTSLGIGQFADWNTAGATSQTTVGLEGLLTKKSGLYMVSVWATANNGTAGQYLEISNATTGVRYALGGLPPGTAAQDLSVSGIVPCSAGDRIGVAFLNFSGTTRALAAYRISFAQII